MRSTLLKFAIVAAFAPAAFADTASRLTIDQKLTGYSHPDIYTPLNVRSGFDRPPGGQNFRTVIPGVLYRGGTGASEGLSPEQLQVFCKEGFSSVTFSYRNGNLGPVSCPGNSYQYEFADPNGAQGAFQFLSRVASAVKENKGPVFVHCWRGHHQSGQFAAYALELFCGFTAEQAVDYWNKTSNGDEQIGISVQKRIRWFAGQKTQPQFTGLLNGLDLHGLCPSGG